MRAFGLIRLRHAADLFRRAEDAQQRRRIINAHVNTDAAALRNRVGEFFGQQTRVALQNRHAGSDVADDAAVHNRARRLNARAEERVRRGAEQQSLFLRQRSQFARLLRLHAEHLLGINMLAVLQQRANHAIMCSGRRQVDHQLDALIRHDFFHRHHRQMIPL